MNLIFHISEDGSEIAFNISVICITISVIKHAAKSLTKNLKITSEILINDPKHKYTLYYHISVSITYVLNFDK